MSDYAFEGPKWANANVTYSFASAGGDFTNSITGAYQAVVQAALARWSAVANVHFQQVADTTPGVDIRIGWGSFSGSQVGETDYSYQGSTTKTFAPGTEVRLEDPSLRAVGTAMSSTYQGTSTTLYETALHELGHSLGLDHSTDASATMYPTLGASNGNLDASDIAGIQMLYGAPGAATVANAVISATTSTTQNAAPAPITLSGNQVPVYRFFDTVHGTQFLTGSTAERDTVIATRPDLTYEGLGLTGISAAAGDPNAAPVFRFFSTTTGTHFLTASATEKDAIIGARSDLVFEGSSFAEHLTQQSGDSAVYRFFDTKDGTHFFTQSTAERASILATRSDMTYEGVAFYAPSNS